MNNVYKILTSKRFLTRKSIKELRFPLSDFEQNQISKLCDTLRYDKGPYEKLGVGISAPQVGILKRFFVMAMGPTKRPCKQLEIIINPKILRQSPNLIQEYEGCLSVPGYQCMIKRSEKIQVQYQNLMGKIITTELDEFYSRVFLHEIDHLNGIIMSELDNVQTISNPIFEQYKKKKLQQNY